MRAKGWKKPDPESHEVPMVHTVNKAVTEAKVKAATATAAVSILVLQLLDFVPVIRDLDKNALGIVLDAVVTAGLATLATFWAGWQARHTPRPDLETPGTSEGSLSQF